VTDRNAQRHKALDHVMLAYRLASEHLATAFHFRIATVLAPQWLSN